MDPDVTLAEMRSAAAARDWKRFAELWDVLDGWLSRGGYLPEAWRYALDKTAQRLQLLRLGYTGDLLKGGYSAGRAS